MAIQSFPKGMLRRGHPYRWSMYSSDKALHQLDSSNERSLMLHVGRQQVYRLNRLPIPLLRSFHVTHTAGQDGQQLRSSSELSTPQLQPSVKDDEGTKTLRLRQHGNRSLPLPPIMDPIAVAAKERHTTPKRSVEKKELTDFQKALATNPYGMAVYRQSTIRT